MKNFKKLLTLSMSLFLLLTICMPVQATAVEGSILPTVTLKPKEEGVLTFNEGQERTLDLVISSTVPLTMVTITPAKSALIWEWPFNLTNANLTRTIDNLPADKPTDISYTFTARDNVIDTFYGLKFEINAAELSTPVESTIFVQTMPKKEPVAPPPTPDPGSEGGDLSGGTGGSFESGGVNASGGGAESPTGIPRVIVTGFTTTPDSVIAGGNFRLIVHLKNTSTKTKVTNMLINFEAPTEGDASTAAPAFLPSSGSGSVYLDGIAKNGTADVAIDLNAKVDLVQKPYTINLSMSYEDASANAFETTASLSIPVMQEARFEFSKFEINPSSISVGDDVNVMTNLYNTGRIKLYNVKIKFMGDGIETQDLFIGHVESGSTAPIDGMIATDKATDGPQSFKMIMTYEDEAGDTLTQEETFELDIMDSMSEDMMMDGEFMYDEMMMEEGSASRIPSFLPMIIGGVIVVGVVISIIVVKRMKKKRAAMEEDELTDELIYNAKEEDEPTNEVD